MNKEALPKEELKEKPLRCPKCGSLNVVKGHVSSMDLHFCECKDCHHKFYIEKE